MTVETSAAAPVLPMPVRLEFVHALVQHVADGVGARVLHVKGVAAAQQLGLTDRRPGDVDVLVAPADVGGLVAALVGAGWESETTRTPRLVGHAVVLHHPAWGCAIDLHHRFPGIEVAPATAFDRLWASRVTTRLGGRPAAVPAYVAHALLLLLHAARGQGSPRASDDVRQVRAALDACAATELARWAARLGCGAALAGVLPAWRAGGRGARGWHWRLLAGREVTGVELWAGRIATAGSWRHRLALLGSALFPDRATLSARSGRDLSGVRLLMAAARRWGTAAGEALRLATRTRAAPSPVPAAVVPDVGSGFATLPVTGEPVALSGPLADRPLAVRDHGEHTWVADLDTAEVWLLSPSAALVWDLARDHPPGSSDDLVAAIVAHLRREVAQPSARLWEEVRDALALLVDLGLVAGAVTIRPLPGPS